MINIENWLGGNTPSSVILTNLRSQGEIIIPGGDKAYDLKITGRLSADNYTNLVSTWKSMENAIKTNTPYYLKIDTSQTTTDDIKVMRILPIIMDRNDKLNKWVYYILTLRANSWS